jgi:hypothetical protein
MRRPSPAMFVAVTALVVAMSGTAVAATGGEFILGKANNATSVTSLSNTKGTALALSAPDGKPPLTVSNSTQVADLNASLLDGNPAGAFLGVNGTAANSRDLGGQPYTDYVTGAGQVSGDTGLIDYGTTYTVPLTVVENAFQLTFECANADSVYFTIIPATNGAAWALNSGGQEYVNMSTGDSFTFGPYSSPATSVVQVAFGSGMVTLWLSDSANTANDTCTFAAQSMSDG